MLFLKPEARVEGAALTVLGSVSQLLVTFLCGTIGLVWFNHAHPVAIGSGTFTTEAVLIIAAEPQLFGQQIGVDPDPLGMSAGALVMTRERRQQRKNVGGKIHR